jgi:hypothetical protein
MHEAIKLGEVHVVEHLQLYGPYTFHAEFWVERMAQTLKRITKDRMGKCPCKIVL